METNYQNKNRGYQQQCVWQDPIAYCVAIRNTPILPYFSTPIPHHSTMQPINHSISPSLLLP